MDENSDKTRGKRRWTVLIWKQALTIAKTADDLYRADLELMLMDIVNINITDTDLANKYKAKNYSDDMKKKFRETKIDHNEHSLLHLAAKFNRRKFFSFLIDDIKINKNVLTKSKQTPIHYFIESNIIYKQNYIHETKSDFEKTIFEKQISLVLEAKNNEEKKNTEAQIYFEKFIQLFVKHSCDFNLKDENGQTPLHLAARLNNYAAVANLISIYDVDINAKDKNGFTPLHLACKHGSEEVAELLINKIEISKLIDLITSESSDISILPLHLVCKLKDEKIFIINHFLNRIKAERIDQLENVIKKTDEKKQTILHLAIENHQLKIVELLLRDFNASKNLKEGVNGNMPIHLAAKLGSIEIFNLLQKYDAVSFETNNNSENALHIAAYYNRNKFIAEFLKYEMFLMNENSETDKNTDENYDNCACKCGLDAKSHIPSVRVRDNKLNTPLLVALACSNQKCVEELIDNIYIELDATDCNGNTIYHVCTENENFESLNYLIEKFNPNNEFKVYNIKNSTEETILHSSCRKGNLEITNLIMNKLHETNTVFDELLFSKNKDGQTCFHVAASKGYFNLVEYFLKKKKISQFKSQVDDHMNTGLHLATANGHSTVVNLLLSNGVDANAKNDENLTALTIGCNKGYFEICKNLIEQTDISNINESSIRGLYPLHYAATDGAYEVVKMLLDKGTEIDKLNDENQNCLDMAIANGHREVIRILLNDKSWYKLIRTNGVNTFDFDEDNDDLKLVVVSNQEKTTKSHQSIKQISTFFALYNNEMWDMMKLLLDKCKIDDEKFNFSVIDPPGKSISQNALMLIARSGQETLVKHDVTTVLLNLKWRFIPRFLFFFNLFLYLLFLFLFSWYSIELPMQDSELANDLTNNDFAPKHKLNVSLNQEVFNNNSGINIVLFRSRGFKFPANKNRDTAKKSNLNDSDSSESFLQDFQDSVEFHLNRTESSLNDLLVFLIVFQLIKEIFIFVYVEGFYYLLSLQNLMEIATYLMSLIGLLSISYYYQTNFASIAILLAYILLPIFLQRFKSIGIYVIALKRTLFNSTKLTPIFIILFTGFLFSFKLRSDFGVTYSESESGSFTYSLIRTVTMVVGELDSTKMGLSGRGSLPNLIIYLLFIGLMCTIVLNLFVGIAVDDIKTILDEADIQLICMKIMYVLKVQSAIHPLFNHCSCLRPIINMYFKKYEYQEENKFFKLINSLKNKTRELLESKEPKINLLDPNKRLENTFTDVSREMNDKISNFKNIFENQMGMTESKLLNAQVRLQDSLNEFSITTTSQLNVFREEVKVVNNKIKNDLDSLQKVVKETNEDIAYTKKYFNTRLSESEQKFLMQIMKLEGILIEMARKALFQFESVKESCITEPKNLRSIIINSEKLLEEFLADLIKSNQQNVNMNDSLFENFVQNEICEKLIKPGNEELKHLINNMFDKTIDKFKSNEANFYIQKLQLESMSNNLNDLFAKSMSELKADNKLEFHRIRKESAGLENKLTAIETQLKLFNENILKQNTNQK